MTTRLGPSVLAIATALLLCLFAGPAFAAFSGDAGGGFRYESFELTQDRDLKGFIVNTKDVARRNVRVTITAIGKESGDPLWSTKLNLGNMSPGERKQVSAGYGHYTADPGSFNFEFTEEGEVEPQAPGEVPEPATPGEEEPQAPGQMQERNTCSRIEGTLHGREISGSGECTTVQFKLAKGSARFALRYTPTDPITVQLLNKDGKPLEFLFEQLTYSTGSKRLDVKEEGAYSLQILAQGEWSIRIQQAGAPAEEGNATQASPRRPINMDSGDDGSLSISNY